MKLTLLKQFRVWELATKEIKVHTGNERQFIFGTDIYNIK